MTTTGKITSRFVIGICCHIIASCTAIAATWYVDNAATGSNNGTSWANAWNGFASIGWAQVNAGDTIYISGGSISKTYNETLTISRSGTSANRLTIQVGQAAGHNGKVVVDAQNTRAYCISLQGSYVTISGNNGTSSTNLFLKNATNPSDRYAGVALAGTGSSGILEYLDIQDCNNGMALTGARNTIRYCYLHGIRGDRGIYVSGSSVYDDTLIYNCTLQLNFGSGGLGPDGIQGGNGITVHDCYLYSATGPIVGAQHMDGIQCIGSYWKIYNNLTVNMANACIEGGSVGSSWNDYMVYNNIWALVENNPNGYQRGFEFTPNSPITAVRNIYVVNNTAVDLTFRAIYWGWNSETPTISNVVIANNIIYDCGRNDTRAIDIADSPNASSSDYMVDYNDINAGSGGKTAIIVDGIAVTQAHPRAGVPVFNSYTLFTAANDYRLKATDTACKDQGITVSGGIAAVDRLGVARPQGAGWDIGAYEYSAGTSNANVAPVVSGMGQNPADMDLTTPGVQVLDGSVVQYSGSATDANGDAMTWQWIYTVNGGAEVVYQSGSGTVTAAIYTYGAGIVGKIYVWKLRVSDGKSTGEGQLSVVVVTAATNGLSFEAESGVVSAPFVVSGGGISQATQTDVTSGGRAVYSFMVTNAGNYVIQAVVNAATEAGNSFYVNVDGEPQDPGMIWQIPVTSGFESRIVSWQGGGTFDNPQFVPKVFNLTAGTHQLIIRGREANTQLDRISILKFITPPSNMRSANGP